VHLRQRATEAGGHATLFRWAGVNQTPADGVFQPLDPVSMAVIKRLKQELDPKSIFNPGRLVAGI
jgi:glycolate oxidase FAD binding subunit